MENIQENYHLGKSGRYKKHLENINLSKNKEHIKQYNKKYYEERKNNISKVHCVCGLNYMETHKEKHEQTTRHQFFMLKFKIQNKNL